ncbi:uncharacterized protein Z520_01768 [Fonsecaea multimorphosa CBS 102226]|uniref:Apple domain-containing protein n=1 Tax=Fonsecaea multimorphosa CBS 102226 TaxID=1442371 RepID=A0A0D2HN95_9EURO|nr:uncharacterized protein Z520_01768 [Fonsecaea multimorphosa CBS 102226]KIY03301.1 hypothetical protein Z520_01768 [Fonsecaea multimorphosa CBS 102226]OAL30218.1 hypothetical protein AYO22_01734 [Fonsecaea multimorphosa]
MFSLAIIFAYLSGLFVCAHASSAVCSQPPYALFLPLSNFAPAETFCSSKFPLHCTVTSTTTSTSTSVNTVDTTYSTAIVTTGTTTISTTVDTSTIYVYISTATETSTTDTTTLTVTTGTSTTVSTATATSTVTITTASPTPARLKRSVPSVPDFLAHPTERIPEPPVFAQPTPAFTTLVTAYNDAGAAAGSSLTKILCSLQAEAASVFSTVCSCIEASPTCQTNTVSTTVTETSTVTSSIVATSLVQATSITSVTATDTISTDTTTTTSVEATTTASVEATTTSTTTTTTTTTTTVYTAAPTCAGVPQGTYTDSNGHSYQVTCSCFLVDAISLGAYPASTFDGCMVQCDQLNNCVAAQWNEAAGVCGLLAKFGSNAVICDPSPGLDGAMKLS